MRSVLVIDEHMCCTDTAGWLAIKQMATKLTQYAFLRLRGSEFLKLTVLMDEGLEDAALVLEHPKLVSGIEAMAGSQEGR